MTWWGFACRGAKKNSQILVLVLLLLLLAHQAHADRKLEEILVVSAAGIGLRHLRVVPARELDSLAGAALT